MRCFHCGQPLRPEAAFCPWCGGATGVPTEPVPPPPPPPWQHAPAPDVPAAVPRRRAGWRAPVLVIGLVVLLGIAGVVAVTSRHHTPAAAPAGDVPVAAGPSVAAPPVTGTGVLAPPPTTASRPVDAASAKAALDDELAQDEDIAEQLVDQWVPQLSSKRPGLVADGVRYDYQRIWRNFQELRRRYPNVLLIWSGNYSDFRSSDFYVTVVAMPYADGQDANQWCADEQIAATDCYAKLLSHRVGPAGTALLRN
jgi:hypothetical protein